MSKPDDNFDMADFIPHKDRQFYLAEMKRQAAQHRAALAVCRQCKLSPICAINICPMGRIHQN